MLRRALLAILLAAALAGARAQDAPVGDVGLEARDPLLSPAGEVDFILKCVAPDLKTFQGFVEKLTAAPNVRNVKTSLTLRNSKDAAMVPIDD